MDPGRGSPWHPVNTVSILRCPFGEGGRHDLGKGTEADCSNSGKKSLKSPPLENFSEGSDLQNLVAFEGHSSIYFFRLPHVETHLSVYGDVWEVLPLVGFGAGMPLWSQSLCTIHVSYHSDWRNGDHAAGDGSFWKPLRKLEGFKPVAQCLEARLSGHRRSQCSIKPLFFSGSMRTTWTIW
jgi:hypothetical protein